MEDTLNSVDFFDHLPDEIVLSIFNKLQDAKSLCLSMSVCKRFHSIAPQVNQIYLHIPHKKTGVKQSDQESQKGFFKNLAVKSLHFISKIINSKSKNDENNDPEFNSFYVPNNVLKPFEEMRDLHLRLPCHGFQKQGKKNENSTTFLKWKAEFGSELHSCVMLGAKSLTEKHGNEAKFLNSRVIGDDELKLRIVWTISCLIAAAARHYLIQDIVKSYKLIENLVVSDESDQGKVCMNKEQMKELRGIKRKGDDDNVSVFLDYRGNVPTLRMKMWYLEKLELCDGKVMEGATLVVIRPASSGVEETTGRSGAELVAAGFGVEGDGNKVVEEAVRKLIVAKKCYTLEMNSV